MKNRKLLNCAITVLAPLALALGVFVGITKPTSEEAKGYTTSALPTTIDLNDTSEANIRLYYSSLNGKSESERKGSNLLKHLKTILKTDQKYYAYDGTSEGKKIWQIYEIADRDWSKSPASAITCGTYNSNTNTITNYEYGTSYSKPGDNPYIHALYVDRNVTNEMRAWRYGSASENNHGGNKEWYIDREHIWPKSQGFNESGAGGARGDPMHLWSGDSDVNSSIHNNNFYGFVDKSSSYSAGKYSYATCNYCGTSLTLKSGDNVFEPQDCDKGDIARAIFYMVARYNYVSGSDSDDINQNNPNLELVQDNTILSSYTSDVSTKGKMGILTDLLEWHHLDPVDEWEIHRNNLLYNNYTNNRNPFIDFPEWVDFIWGTAEYNGRNYQSYSSTPTGAANPSGDTINGYNSGAVVDVESVSLDVNSTLLAVGTTEQLTATVSPSNATDKSLTWTSSNTGVATVSSTGLVTGVADGTATITVKSNADSSKKATCTVQVTSSGIAVTSVSLSESAITLDIGGSETLSATVLPDNATNKNLIWSSSNNGVATVNNGVIKAIAGGSAVITARSESDSSKKATCNITVNEHVTLSHTYSPFEDDTGEANPDPVGLGGITYENAYGLIYESDSLEFSKNTNAFLANSTPYGKTINRIVLNWYGKYNNDNCLAVYEGKSALPSTNAITSTKNGTVSTYNFTANTNKYFKIQVTSTSYYLRFSTIEIYFDDATVGVLSKTYKLVTDASDLRTGDKIIFAGIRDNTYYTATAKSSNYLRSEESTYENGFIDIGSSTTPFTVTRSNALFNFFDGSKYASIGSNSASTYYEESTVSDNSTFSVSIDSSGNTTIIGQGNYQYKYFRFNSSSSSLFFNFQRQSSSNANVYIYKQYIEVLADEWSQTFLNDTNEISGGKTVCTISNWDSLASSYKALDSSVRTEIAEVEANASTEYSLRAQAMARYDYFMGDSRFNNVEHFVTGRAASLSARPIELFNYKNDSVVTIIVIASVLNVSTFGCLCIIKKKKMGTK